MGHKTKFNKQKCANCIYHSRNSGRVGLETAITCNYSGVTGHTCLTTDEHRKVIDRRGDDFNKCKLRKVGTRGKTGRENRGLFDQ